MTLDDIPDERQDPADVLLPGQTNTPPALDTVVWSTEDGPERVIMYEPEAMRLDAWISADADTVIDFEEVWDGGQ